MLETIALLHGGAGEDFELLVQEELEQPGGFACVVFFEEPKRLVSERSFAISACPQTIVFVTLVRVVTYKGKLFPPRLDIQVPLHGMEYQHQSTDDSTSHEATASAFHGLVLPSKLPNLDPWHGRLLTPAVSSWSF